MYLSVIDKGMSISLTVWEGSRKVVSTLKSYTEKGRASKVLSMSRKAGLSTADVIEKLRKSPSNLLEEDYEKYDPCPSDPTGKCTTTPPGERECATCPL
jgi:hypothetical protein